MSKSKAFLPGAKELLNGTYFHLTSVREKPSCLATAYATADSKPLPVLGSLIFQNELFVPPPNQGGYAGLSVPTVRTPLWTRWRFPLLQLLAAVPVLEALSLLLEPQPATTSTPNTLKAAAATNLMP